MEKYILKSIIAEIAKGIEGLIDKGVIQQDRKLILYGLDRNSFAMRTILANKNYHNIECFISDDEAAVVAQNRDINNFICRFLNQATDVIWVKTLQDRLGPYDDSVSVLIASPNYEEEKNKLIQLGYKENVHFFRVYDFLDPEIDSMFEGKRLMTLKDMQQVEKELLAYVDDLCIKHGIRYWVCGGTLLGTIRHKGFIPWDDDVDVFMPWKDYLKFIEVFEETERYSMLGMGTSDTKEFSEIFAKVLDRRAVIDENLGTVRKINPVWLDVFPLIGLPADAEERKLYFENYQELHRKIWQDFYAANGDVSVFPKWYKAQREFLEKYDFDRSDYVGTLGSVYGERDCATRAAYEKTVRMPFEDIEVNVPVGYKEYLDSMYGKDWGELPEESKRKSHHNIKAYWV